MKYSIVYDKPQRIRFRCGAYAFDKAYEGCIYNFLIEKNYVKKVEVNSENGGILVMYDKGYRQNVIDVIASIERRASGTDALGAALDLIRSGRLDVCISGGTEAAIDGFGVASFTALQALSSSYNDTPKKASRPFDKDRDGFVLGEGSAVFMLEELEHAKKRGAKIYAEVAGFGSSCDAYHITAPLKDGSGAALAVKEALKDAGMQPADIQYYNAHGTSTHANDSGETNMLKLAFGEHAYKLHISSTKSMTGHLVGAAGAIEALFCVKAINESFVPPTINLDNQDIEGGCDLDYTPNKGISLDIEAAASASLGFGGHNGCIIIKKYR